MSNSARAKVFGIGFHKTGTSSLGTALTLLGYRVAGVQGIWDPNIASKVHEIAFSVADQFDAFQDNPWPVLYRELDKRYPGSKFILTLRSTQEWIASVVQHFGSETSPMREWIYGVGNPLGNESIYVSRYETHNMQVIDYFKERPGSLLQMHITEGDGWRELCPFLELEMPDCEFPDVNKASDLEGPI